MAANKLTITLQDEQLQEIRALVAAGHAANVAAFMQHAVGIALSDAAGWLAMLQEALEHGRGDTQPGPAGASVAADPPRKHRSLPSKRFRRNSHKPSAGTNRPSSAPDGLRRLDANLKLIAV